MHISHLGYSVGEAQKMEWDQWAKVLGEASPWAVGRMLLRIAVNAAQPKTVSLENYETSFLPSSLLPSLFPSLSLSFLFFL